jgi:hypothetical protein
MAVYGFDKKISIKIEINTNVGGTVVDDKEKFTWALFLAALVVSCLREALPEERQIW